MLGEMCDHAVQSGAKKLIIDVRGNPGGQAVISRLMIVAFRGRSRAVKAIPTYTIPRLFYRVRDTHRVSWPGPLRCGSTTLQHEGCRHRRLYGVPTAFQHAHPGGGGQPVGTGDHAEVAHQLGSGRHGTPPPPNPGRV